MRLTKRRGQGHGAAWIEHGFSFPAVFDDFSTRDLFRPSFGTTGVSTPAVNIIETRDDFRVEMVAPGMKKEAFKVTLESDVLTIAYDHEDNREGERREWRYMTREYNYHSFSRSFYLPEIVVAEKIEARYTDGILTLVIPKREDAKGNPSRRIEVA